MRVWAWAVGATVPGVFVVLAILQIVVTYAAGEYINLVGPAFLYAAIGATATCALVAVAVGRARSQRFVIESVAMGVLAGLAPISLVIFARLSYRACSILNVLGLPWPEPWREIAHWGSGLIWLSSTIYLVVAVAIPRLRRPATAMWIWSAAIALPTVMLFFLITYGDPAPGCTPV